MRTAHEKIRFLGKRLLLVPLLVLAVSCGSSQGTVTGKVYYKEKMLTVGSVNFVYEGPGGAIGSPISSDGTYTITKAPRGLAKITVLTGSSSVPSGKMGPGGRGGPPKEAMEKYKEKMKEMTRGKSAEGGGEMISLPQKYSDPEKSGLQLEVTGGKQTFDIKID